MRLWAIWDVLTGSWWTSTRGHPTFSSKSAATNAYNYAFGLEPPLRLQHADKPWKMGNSGRYILKEVRLVPVETP